jgi:hypothetical protein
MNNKKRSHVMVLAAALGLLATAAFADSKPDFTGTWKLNVEKSDFGGGPTVRGLQVKIERCDTVLKYSVSGTDSEGNAIEEALEVPIDGQPHDWQGKTVTLRWEGDTLVGETKGGDGDAVETAHVTMSEGGSAFLREVTTKTADGEVHAKEVYEKE